MIAIRDLSLQQGKFSLAGISLTIPSGAYGVLMGRTGCGKTSILEAVAGLRRIRSGSIMLGERDVTHDPPAARGVGYVPQDGALFQTMTIYDHLAFALVLRKERRALIEQRVAELAQWLRIEHLLERTPKGLSGGEAQRVALGRALSFRPQFLLLDEPLSSLDEETRELLVRTLLDLRDQRQVTVLHVTHNPTEAERLADVQFRLENGSIREEQRRIGTPG